jgi:hypothetical protein
MKKTPKQWLEEISTTSRTKGNNNWYTASCPICGDSQDATVVSSGAAAETAARGKVLAQIRMSHADHVDETKDTV